MTAANELQPRFFQRHPTDCARDLIGCHFRWNGCEARIVETEAYAARGDPACHTFFRKDARAFVAAHPAGTAYVYLNYGVHWLFNVLVKDEDDPAGGGFVLFRALDPLNGIPLMRARRPAVRDDALLCAGPGRLTRALGIDGSVHGSAFLGGADTGIRRAAAVSPVAGPRIGISRAIELPWRFGEAGAAGLSRKF